jgi:hypothetical protein
MEVSIFSWHQKQNQDIKWPYFHTVSISHKNIQWKLIFHTNGHILTRWAYFTQIPIESQIFTQMVIFSHIEHIYTIILLLFIAVLVFWNSLTFHGGRWCKYRALLIKLFLNDGFLDSDDSSFSRYNHLNSFVCCFWNIEHLSNMFY